MRFSELAGRELARIPLGVRHPSVSPRGERSGRPPEGYYGGSVTTRAGCAPVCPSAASGALRDDKPTRRRSLAIMETQSSSRSCKRCVTSKGAGSSDWSRSAKVSMSASPVRAPARTCATVFSASASIRAAKAGQSREWPSHLQRACEPDCCGAMLGSGPVGRAPACRRPVEHGDDGGFVAWLPMVTSSPMTPQCRAREDFDANRQMARERDARLVQRSTSA